MLLCSCPCTRRCLLSPCAHVHECTLCFPHDRTRQSIHIWVSLAAAWLWPLQLWKRSQANTNQQRPVRMQRNTGGALLTESRGVGSDVCVCVCVSETTRPHRGSCQSAWGLMGVRYRDEGMQETMMQGSVWGWRDKRVLTASLFFTWHDFFYWQ